MTNDEIRALVDRKIKSAAHAQLLLPSYREAISTLLARQDEVAAVIKQDYSLNAERIHNILNQDQKHLQDDRE